MHIRIILKCFEKYKCSSIAFFSRAPDVSNEQSCLKAIGLHDDLLLLSSFFTGEGNGTPLQYSCLENPMDGGAWWAAVYGVAQSRTGLKRLSSSSLFHFFYFIISAPISFSLCSPMSPTLFFFPFDVLYQAFIKCSGKAFVYMYKNIYQFSSVAQSCPTLCDPTNCSTPGFPVHHQLPKLTQTHVHRVGDAIQPSHPLLSPSLPAPNPSQHQGLFQ